MPGARSGHPPWARAPPRAGGSRQSRTPGGPGWAGRPGTPQPLRKELRAPPQPFLEMGPRQPPPPTLKYAFLFLPEGRGRLGRSTLSLLPGSSTVAPSSQSSSVGRSPGHTPRPLLERGETAWQVSAWSVRVWGGVGGPSGLAGGCSGSACSREGTAPTAARPPGGDPVPRWCPWWHRACRTDLANALGSEALRWNKARAGPGAGGPASALPAASFEEPQVSRGRREGKPFPPGSANQMGLCGSWRQGTGVQCTCRESPRAGRATAPRPPPRKPPETPQPPLGPSLLELSGNRGPGFLAPRAGRGQRPPRPFGPGLGFSAPARV